MIVIFSSIQDLELVGALPSGVTIGIPAVSIDGRVAISHNFAEEDITVLLSAGATVQDQLPEDWQYPATEV